MKKFFESLILSFLLIACVILIGVSANPAKAEIASGTWGGLTWEINDNGCLTISGSGNMNDFPVVSSTLAWRPQTSSIKKIVIGYGVTSIGERAFYGCSSSTSITIPDSVTSIGKSAFNGCAKLTGITIPDSVTSIEDATFGRCSSITSITIPDSVTSIGGSAFYNCDKLTSITIPNSVTSIGNNAFSGCTSLTGITIPNSVTSIGGSAFYNCSKLTSITIPNSVTSIGKSAFMHCISLSSVKIPDSVKSIEDDTFFECCSLTSIIIPDGVTSIGYSAFADCCNLTSITIPNSVTTIAYDAFNMCECYTTIYCSCDSFAASYRIENCCLEDWYGYDSDYILEYIPHVLSHDISHYEAQTATCSVPGWNAYDACSRCDYSTKEEYLLEHTFVNGVCTVCGYVKIIAEGDLENLHWKLNEQGLLTISGNGAMADLDFDDEYTVSADFWFIYSRYVTSVTIEEGVTSISAALDYFYNAKSISIPASVTRIEQYESGWGMFYSFSNLTNIVVSESNPNYSSYEGVLFNKDRSVLIHYPQGRTGAYIIPESVKKLANRSFLYECRTTDITIPANVTSIEDDAIIIYDNFTIYCPCDSAAASYRTEEYYDCENEYFPAVPHVLSHDILHYEAQAATCTAPGWNAYDACSKCDYSTKEEYLLEHTFVNGVCTVCGYVKTIAEGDLGNLHWKLNINGLLTIYGNGSMSDFTSTSSSAWTAYRNTIESVVIESGVTSIGKYAFYNCSNLASITISDSVTNIGNNAFAYCSKLNIYLPDNIMSVGNNSFLNTKKVFCNLFTYTSASLVNAGCKYCIVDNPDFVLTGESGTVQIYSYIGNKTNIIVPNHVNKWNAVTYQFSEIKLPSTLSSTDTFSITASIVTVPDGVTSLGNLTVHNCTEIYVPASVTDLSSTALYGNNGNKPTVCCYMDSEAEAWAIVNDYNIRYLDQGVIYTMIYAGESILLDVGEAFEVSRDDFAFIPIPVMDMPITFSVSAGLNISGNTIQACAPGNETLSVCMNGQTWDIPVYVYTPISSFDITAPSIVMSGHTFEVVLKNASPAGGSGAFRWQQDGILMHVSDKADPALGFDEISYTFTAPDGGKDTVLTITAPNGVSRSVTVHVPEHVSAPYAGGNNRTAFTGDIIDISVDCDGKTYTNEPLLYGEITIPSSASSIIELTDNNTVRVIGTGRTAFSVKGWDGKAVNIIVVASCRHQPVVDCITLAGSTDGTVSIICDECGEQLSEETIGCGTILSLPSGLKSVGEEAFAGISAQQVEVPSGCTAIGERSFANCASLKLIVIPSSVTSIASDAFSGCGNVIIYCNAGSYAQQFAEFNNMICYMPE